MAHRVEVHRTYTLRGQIVASDGEEDGFRHTFPAGTRVVVREICANRTITAIVENGQPRAGIVLAMNPSFLLEAIDVPDSLDREEVESWLMT